MLLRQLLQCFGDASYMKWLRTISAMRFVVMLAFVASCGVASDNPRDDPENNTDVTADTGSTAASEVAVLPELQLITPDVTCKSAGGVCTSSALCRGSGGHTITGSCAAGKVCCTVSPPSINAGGVCTSSALCQGSGGHSINEPCPTTKICCAH